MDTRDKLFDNWIKNNLNSEIVLTKQNRQSAWEHIQATVNQPISTLVFEDDFIHITTPIISSEPLHIRLRQWAAYFFTKESTYQKAHDNSVQYYKAKPNYCSGLTLHDLEMMRHRWTCPV